MSSRVTNLRFHDESIITFAAWTRAIGSTVHSFFGRSQLFVCIGMKYPRYSNRASYENGNLPLPDFRVILSTFPCPIELISIRLIRN
jgi:hypothetical protein